MSLRGGAAIEPRRSFRPETGRLDFLQGGGEMGAIIRAFDWSATPLGVPANWSPALRTMIRILLANRFPMLLWWGPEYISIYNDAYSPILGRKHPWGLGRPVRECWSEIWDVLRPLIDTPFHGGPPTWSEDIELQINRFGLTEETHFTIAYSPVPDDEAGIGGVLATVHEITDKVVGARRGAILRELGARTSQANSAEQACTNAVEILQKYAKDIPFALLYLLKPQEQLARLVASTGVDTSPEMAPPAISLADFAPGVWPLAAALKTKESQTVTELGVRFRATPRGTWPDPPTTAVVVPIRSNSPQPAGFLVAGLSSHLKVDQAYRDFLDLAAAQIASAIASARAWEEERERAEALAEIDRAKTAFFSNVSHEFRTPLTLMLGPLESVLANKDSTSAEAREQIATAHRNSLRLLKLVNSLLDFSRIEADRIKATFAPVDLASFTRDLASTFRSALESAGLKFEVNCPPLPQPVYVDSDLWEKIVLNLLSNAFKFTFEGRVSLNLTAHGDQAVLTVSDTGTGIPESELPHIFERFHRVEGARGRTYEGTGIGLALIQELAKIHGGVINVDSRLGQGSVFTVAIPFGTSHLQQDRIAPAGATPTVRAESYLSEAASWLAHDRLTHPSDDIGSFDQAGGSDQEDSAPTPALNAARPLVLIADDNADMREHTSRILGSTFELIGAANGEDALSAARKRKPDLILSDVMMPGLDGFGLLQALRADPALREVPVILLSARAGDEARTEGIAAGADDYLTKPFSAKELLARVETTLNLQRIRREAQDEIERSEERFRAFVTATSDVVYSMSPDWSEMRHLAGRDFVADTADPSPGWLDKYIHPDDRHRVLEAVQTAIASKTPFEFEHRVIRVDGSLGWTFSRAVPILNAKEEIVEWFGAARDVTERKAAERALQEANAALTRSNADLQQFAYSASHDLQEPLRMVAAYSELLKREFADQLGPEGQEYIGYTFQGAMRMERLLKDLRAYTLASTSNGEPAVDLDSNRVLDKALANLEAAIKENAAVITRTPLPSVRIHEFPLEQLFQNLIGNSIHYRRAEPPRIHVSARRDGDAWLFSVEDNGIGIQPQYKEQIFAMFARLHTAAEYPGTGMGLAICQRVVERTGGRIWVDSEPGQGSTFFFTIPVKQ